MKHISSQRNTEGGEKKKPKLILKETRKKREKEKEINEQSASAEKTKSKRKKKEGLKFKRLSKR